MRRFSIVPAVLGLVMASAALAQQQPAAAQTPSVAGYLCTFAHKCGDEAAAPVETRAAPRTKGFRLARATPSADERASRATPVPRGGGMSERRGYARVVATPSVGRRGSRYAVPVETATVSPGLGTVRPRADLMIGFELNSARLSQAGMASARVFAQSLLMSELSNKRFQIEGHTDLRGGRVLNMELSQRRAQAVADYLVAQGVDRTRLTTRGLGPDVPLPGRTPSDPDNRRVEAELGN